MYVDCDTEKHILSVVYIPFICFVGGIFLLSDERHWFLVTVGHVLNFFFCAGVGWIIIEFEKLSKLNDDAEEIISHLKWPDFVVNTIEMSICPRKVQSSFVFFFSSSSRRRTCLSIVGRR